MTFKIIISFLFILNLIVFNVISQQSDSYCLVDSSGLNILCQNFTNFSQLNLSYFQPTNNQSFKSLKFLPNGFVNLDDSLYLGNLQVSNDSYEIVFSSISSIDILANPFAEIDPLRKYTIQFFDSIFELIYEGKQIDIQACDYILQNEIFISLAATAQSFSLCNPVYSKIPMCQAFFNTAELEVFDISNINSTNTFNFHSDANITSDFSCDIKNFNIHSSDFSLTESMLDKNVFRTLQSLAIQNSSLRSIQTDLFEYFSYLKLIELELINFGEFFQSNSNKWLSYLNTNISVDLNNPDEVEKYLNQKMELFLIDRTQSYVYSSSDFCLFKDYPHEKLVVPIIETKPDLECTCTLMWLIQYKSIYETNKTSSSKSSNPMYTPSTAKCLDDPNFDKLIENCKFDIYLSQCYSNYTSTPKPSNELEVFRIATIALSVTTVLLIVTIGYIIYHFKFRTQRAYENVDN